MRDPGHNESVTLAKDHLAALAQSELHLARAEVAQGVRDVTSGLALSVAAVVFLLLAGFALSAALIAWLVAEQAFPPWLAAASVGGVHLLLGAILAISARGRLALDRLVPKRSLRSLKRDLDSLKELIHD